MNIYYWGIYFRFESEVVLNGENHFFYAKHTRLSSVYVLLSESNALKLLVFAKYLSAEMPLYTHSSINF